MRFTAKTHERLDENFHNGLHVGADVRSYDHVITKISHIHIGYHFFLPMVFRYKWWAIAENLMWSLQVI